MKWSRPIRRRRIGEGKALCLQFQLKSIGGFTSQRVAVRRKLRRFTAGLYCL
jgi:hypothetical protein